MNYFVSKIFTFCQYKMLQKMTLTISKRNEVFEKVLFSKFIKQLRKEKKSNF